MALVKYGPIVDLVEGSIGGTTFGQGTSGPTARRRAGPGNQRTASQLTARSNQIAAAKLWATLTNLQRAEWSSAAAALAAANAVGRKYTRTGFALFCACNVTLGAAGLTMITDAPTTAEPATLTDVAIQPTMSGSQTTNMFAWWNSGTPTSAAIKLEIGPATSQGATPTRQWLKRITTIAPSTAPPIDVTADYEKVFGDLPQTSGYKMLARFTPVDATTGIAGCPSEYTLSIATPLNTPPPSPGTTCSTATDLTEANLYTRTQPGSTTNWYALPTTPGEQYTLTWKTNVPTTSVTIEAGTSCSALTTLATLAQTDAATWTAEAGQNYFLAIETTPTAARETWIITLNEGNQPPAITAITPSFGPAAGGTRVTIEGSGFTVRTLVYFGTTPTLRSRTISPTRIEAWTPATSAGTVPVTLESPTGCSEADGAPTFTFGANTMTSPIIVNSLALTGQAADITGTILAVPTTKGVYRLQVYLACTTADPGAGTVTTSLTWTDDTLVATNQALQANINLTTVVNSGLVNPAVFEAVAGQPITLSATGGGFYGAAQYSLYAVLEQIS
jgi:IPT/TIG domain